MNEPETRATATTMPTTADRERLRFLKTDSIAYLANVNIPRRNTSLRSGWDTEL
jgi:hypothetical protein